VRYVGLLALLLLVLGGAASATPGGTGLIVVAPGGSDAASCTMAAPCRSLDRAYRRARPGQTVGMLAGSYPRQVISSDPRKTAARDVLVRPEPGQAAVTINGIDDYASHIAFRDLRVAGSWRALEAADVTFRRVNASRFVIASSSGVRVLGGRLGPSDNASNDIAPIDLTTTRPPRDILLDRVTIGGFHRTDGESHVDCLHTWGVDRLIIRRSRFFDCEHFDILLNADGSAGPPRNVLVENTFLDCCRSGYYSVFIGHGAGFRNILIRNNSSDKPMGVQDNASGPANVSFLANVVPSFDGCHHAGVLVDYNVLSRGSRCGPHDRRRASRFVNAGRFDFHLRRNAAAINHGDPKSFPRTDIDGQRRPLGRKPDAGADESR
jgi:hypothetical protein